MEAPDREEFRSWLVAKEPDEVVGKAQQGRHCPGANYLTETLGAQCHISSVEAWLTPSGPFLFEHPPWLINFIDGVDDLGGFDRDITAKEALTILDSIEDSP